VGGKQKDQRTTSSSLLSGRGWCSRPSSCAAGTLELSSDVDTRRCWLFSDEDDDDDDDDDEEEEVDCAACACFCWFPRCV
jgi:hypothetical protein